MWIPGWLYERLPIVYLVCAGACVGWLETSVAALASAALLCGAAALAMLQRRQARGATPAPSPPGPPSAARRR